MKGGRAKTLKFGLPASSFVFEGTVETGVCGGGEALEGTKCGEGG